MAIERPELDYISDERTMLNQWLEFHRWTLAWKCEGLDAAQLRMRSVPPSGLSLLGLVRHMGEVEKNWFQRVLAQEDAPARFYDDANPDGDFDDVATADVDEAFTYWRGACQRSREIERSFASLDAYGHHHGREVDVSLRWVLVHMVEEYARHNGHADLLRECIDGATGD